MNAGSVEFVFTRDVHQSISESLSALNGSLRCETCGTMRDLGDVAHRLRSGWPMHCGYTMRWWTQRQVDAGEVPALKPVTPDHTG